MLQMPGRSECQSGKRKYKPSVPMVIEGNMRLLANKRDKLWALMKHQREYRECSMLSFMQTWLHPDHSATVPGFFTVRANIDSKLSGRKKGGWSAVFVNERWCNPGHVTVMEHATHSTFSWEYTPVLFTTGILLPYIKCLHITINWWGSGIWHHTHDCCWPKVQSHISIVTTQRGRWVIVLCIYYNHVPLQCGWSWHSNHNITMDELEPSHH